PNLKVKVQLRNAAGTAITYVLNIRDSIYDTPKRLITLPSGFVPVRAITTVKNRDLDLGDTVELDGLVVVGLRSGEALRSQPLKLARFGEISPEWAAQGPSKSLLPVPAAPIP